MTPKFTVGLDGLAVRYLLSYPSRQYATALLKACEFANTTGEPSYLHIAKRTDGTSQHGGQYQLFISDAAKLGHALVSVVRAILPAAAPRLKTRLQSLSDKRTERRKH